MPEWLQGDVLDVRKEVVFWLEGKPSGFRRLPRVSSSCSVQYRHTNTRLCEPKPGETRKSMGIPDQLQALGLASFEGRQHSGIDVRDTTLNALVQSLTFDFINSHRMLITLQG
jgi:3'-5' exoribonuclease 1